MDPTSKSMYHLSGYKYKILLLLINVLQYRHTNISKNKHVCSNSDAYLKAGGKHCQQLEVRNYNLVKISYSYIFTLIS